MGYFTRIDLFDLQVRPEKVAEVNAAINEANRGSNHPYGIGMLEFDVRQIWWNWEHSPVEKWDLDEPLIAVLAGWCSRGWIAFWSCEGDGGQWAYELDGAGGYRGCSARRVAALRAAETRRFRKRKRVLALKGTSKSVHKRQGKKILFRSRREV